MKAFIAVLGRDLRTWGYVPLAGVVFAVVVLMAAFLSAGGSRFADAAEASLAISLVVTTGMGLLLGAASLGRDLSGQEATFWLSRPLGSGAIFGGKLTATTFLILGAAALCASPAYLFTRQSAEAGGRFAVLTLALTLSALALAAAGDLMMRARTPLVAVVLVVVFAFVGGVWKVAEIQFQSYRFSLGFQVLFAGAAALLATLLAGRAVAFARARYDVRRQARLLTAILAAALAIAFTAVFVWVWTLNHLPLSAMDRVHVAAIEEGGGRVIVAGSTLSGSAQSAFVVDPPSGSMRRVTANWWAPFDFAGDEAFSLEPAGRGAELIAQNSAGRRTVLAELPLNVSDGAELVAAPDGSAFVIRIADATQVLDRNGAVIGAWKALRASANSRNRAARFATFESADSILIHEGLDGLWDVRRFDLRSRSIETIGRIEGRMIRLLPGLERVLVWQGSTSESRLQLADARTGGALFQFPEGARSATPLAGGGWVATTGGELVVLDPAGAELRRFPVPRRFSGGSMGGEVRPGVLLLRKGWWEPRVPLTSRGAALVDLESGKVMAEIEGVEPIFRSVGSPLPVPGHPATGLLWDGNGLRRIDPATLEVRPFTSRAGSFGGRLPSGGDAPADCMSFEERMGRWIAHAALRIQVESIEPASPEE